MRNETGIVAVNALGAICVAVLLTATAPAFASCDTERSTCADSCATSKRTADIRARIAEASGTSDETREEAKQEAAAIRAEAREEYKICLNNCDAQYNACTDRRVQEDYDD